MCEKHIHRIPKVSYGRLIRVGLVGPKPRPKGVGDGQRVIIPVPLLWRQRGDTEGETKRTHWTWYVPYIR